jgi:SAM-dependent methyltransferase
MLDLPAWDREYTSQKLLSPSNIPHADVVRFVRWLKKEHKKKGEPIDMEEMHVLDLGSGTGRNSFYLREQGAQVIGFEFSPTALALAQKIARHGDMEIEYRLHDIGTRYDIPDHTIDIFLDVTSSNSLSDSGRAVYMKELERVMKPGGYLFLRALSFESDVHAKELVKRFPGPDPDTYVHPDLHIVEKVFSRESLKRTYETYFEILELDKVQHYATVAGRKYKRSYWVVYMQKKTA